MNVETQEQADELNRTGEYGPYVAANGHLMVAPLRWPASDRAQNPVMDVPGLLERDYRVGDRIEYDSFAAWCHPDCGHIIPPEDW